MAIKLPTARSEVDKRFQSQKFAMIGAPKIGKSEFWSPANALYIQTEAGLNHLSVMKVPCRSWDEFREILGELIKAANADKFPYEVVIIDTIDNLVDFANQESVRRGSEKFKNLEVNTVGDIPNGAGWAWSQAMMDMALTKMAELPCAVAFIGHLETKEVKEPTRSIHKQTISIGGKMGGMLLAWADHILTVQSQLKVNELTRVIRTLPTPTMDAGSRGGLVPDQFTLINNVAENWKKFRGLFQ